MKRNFPKKLTSLILLFIMVAALVPVIAINVSAAEVTGKFEKYTGDLVEGDYVITYDTYAMANSVSSGRLTNGTFTVSADIITNPNDTIVWHIAKSGDNWTIYNAAAAKYAAGTGAKNKAQLLDNSTDTKAQWTVTSSNGTFDFVNVANAAANVNKTLRNNGTYGFACYATATGGALTLYKLVEADCDHANTTNHDAKPATCTEDGYTAYTQCNDCDKILSGKEVIRAGHTWDGADCTKCDATRAIYNKVSDVTSLKDGDGIVIYNPSSSKLISATASGNKLAGVDGTVDGSILGVIEGELFLIVRYDMNGDLYFETADGKYLTTGATGNSLTLADELTDLAKWYFDTEGTTATLRIFSRNANYNGNYNQALEYYNAFTTYGAKDDGAYNFEIYKKDNFSKPALPAITGISITLNKGITVNVRVSVSDTWLALNEGAKLVFSNGISLDVKAGYAVYGVDLTPAEINDALTVKLTSADTDVISDKDVSLAAYKAKIEALTYSALGISEAKYNALKALLDAAFVYATAADGDSDTITSDFAAVLDHTVVQDKEVFVGFSGKLDTYASVNIAVNKANITASDKLTVKRGDIALTDVDALLATYVNADGNIVIDGIYPLNFDDVISIESDNVLADFSFNSYLKAVYNQSADANVKNLVAATYLYGLAAEAFATAE